MNPAPPDLDALALGRDGARRIQDALADAALGRLEEVVGGIARDQAGVRLSGVPGLAPLLASDGSIGRWATDALGARCHAVRAILFDKSPATNWSLGWHQDRTICVVDRIHVEGFGPWTTKHGLLHVAPPFDVLAGMVTLRVHLDRVPPSNAPLLIAPGSHKLGRISERDVPHIVKRCGVVACVAERGDIWVYSTPILHASEAAAEPNRRRVLQVDFAARELPGGLQWLGV